MFQSHCNSIIIVNIYMVLPIAPETFQALMSVFHPEMVSWAGSLTGENADSRGAQEKLSAS